MTRLELLKIAVGQARSNGFEFRRWYTSHLGIPWVNAGSAFTTLDSQRRYYVLLFSHEFAHAFWKAGSELTFRVARQTFQRIMPDGSVGTVTRKPFTRRSVRHDVWKYHLRQMAAAEDPLRYIRKYLRVEEELDDATIPDSPMPIKTAVRSGKAAQQPAKSTSKAKPTPRSLPGGLPAFLRRPYP